MTISPQSRRTFNPIILGCFAAAVSLYALMFLYMQRPSTSDNVDFSCYYRAGLMVSAGDGGNVYDVPAQRPYDALVQAETGRPTPVRPFVYAPFFLLVFVPLSHLSYVHAQLLWFATNVAILLSLPFMLVKTVPLTPVGMGLGLLLPTFFLPTLAALVSGQPSILQSFLIAVSFKFLMAGKDELAGVALALSSFKPQFALPIVLALVAARKWRLVLGFISTAVGLVAASVPLIGWRAIAALPRTLVGYGEDKWTVEHLWAMPNLTGFSYTLLGSYVTENELRAGILIASLALVALLMSIFSTRRHRLSTLDLALAVVVSLLSSYHGYLHDNSLLLIVILFSPSYLPLVRNRVFRAALYTTFGAFLLLPFLPLGFEKMVFCISVALLLCAALLLSSDGGEQIAAPLMAAG